MLVGACGIGNHDNMGGLFRNAAAFGAAGLLLKKPAATPSTGRRSGSRWARRWTPFVEGVAAAGMVEALEAWI